MRNRFFADEASFVAFKPTGDSSSFATTGAVIRLTDGDDRYRGGNGDDSILSLAGNDIVRGGGGDDDIRSQQGNDILYGDAGDDYLNGGAGQDRLYGGTGDDGLDGNGARDLLCGGLGADQLDLGRGGGESFSDGARDTVLYTDVAESTLTSTDRVFNFRTGEDKVDLRLIDANISTPEDDAFRFIGTKAFTGTAGELRFGDEGPGHSLLLQGDVDGDGKADFVVQFSLFDNGNETLHTRDFML